MCELVVEYEFYGAVVAAENLVVNGGRSHFVGKTVAHKEIVDTPPRILLARTEAVAPPRIGIGEVGIEEAETVGEPCVQERGHFLAFLVGEPGVFAVGFRIFRRMIFVCLLMSDSELLRIKNKQKASYKSRKNARSNL